MKTLPVVLVALAAGIPGFATSRPPERRLEVSTGVSVMLLQSVFSYQQSAAPEWACRGRIANGLDWQAGLRLGLNPSVRSEGFIRILGAPRIGAWRPVAGIEIGVTGRRDFDAGKNLLRETRRATETGISPLYIAGVAAPISFIRWQRWRFSLLELQIGTHLGHPGRTMRVQLGLLTVGRSL